MITIFSHPYHNSSGTLCIAELNVEALHSESVYEKYVHFRVHTLSRMNKYAKTHHESTALEWLSRCRRTIAFADATGLRPVTFGPNRALFDKTKEVTHVDRGTIWAAGSELILMSEHYRDGTKEQQKALEKIGLVAVELPVDWSPYCGRWSNMPGSAPWTRSFLITYIKSQQVLDQVMENLNRSTPEQVAWNDLSSIKIHEVNKRAMGREVSK